ncbi:MAG: PIN domain nuclease [Aestuariivirga sp.]
MIVVDSSVWIALLRNANSVGVQKLKTIADPQDILVGDLIMLEVLQGARGERDAAAIERNLRQFDLRAMLGDRIAVRAAKNHRLLRQRGITVRKTIDLIIGTFCIEGGHALLHEDRDFEPMAEHLGLAVA